MELSFTRLVRSVFGLCVLLTVGLFAVKFYNLDVPTRNIQSGTLESSKKVPDNNLIQRFLHNVLERSFHKGTSTPVTKENKTLTIIKSFSNSQPANSTYGDKFYREIENRTRLRKPLWSLEEKEYVRSSQFIHYMTCPTTVRKKMMLDDFSSRKFIPEMPILLWNEHFSKAEYQRLSTFKGINGWSDIDAQDVSDSLQLLSAPSNRYLFDDRMVNGVIPKKPGCTRCAIIGNGGVMNGSNKGEEIDAHDYVFRVNVALTKGFEKDVGSKTSFYCFTMVTLSNSLRGAGRYGFKAPPYQKGIKYVFFADNEWTYNYLNAVLRNKPPPRSNDKYNRGPPNFVEQLKAEDVKVVHPDFERYLKWSWVNSTAQHKSVHRPTTGAIMLLLALHTCDEVNVYGFGGSYTTFSEHYYDKSFVRHVFYANHDNNAENALWKRLNDLGIINMYIRN
ncbi:alpha-N-acetylgalactosaminide alpha-2,6-sialyltransferase 2-like [Asterias rubens]|uniref:alpha-N-acetylgalactosaminide alpha-2,6-sialyltransferase 2-like n=1 Tax=Asterias rubens TaxID=7604 RepID=UPI0014550885|nr:alpha-N-acetylgalactosaminide alpha-2,6-sialyltransferase 2-like [Asterias rubens]